MTPTQINRYGFWITIWVKIILLAVAGAMMLFRDWLPCFGFALVGCSLNWINDGRWFPKIFPDRP